MTTVQTMEKDHRNQLKLDKTRAILRQFPHGIGVVELARKLGVGRSTVYGIMKTLDLQGKGYLEAGICYSKDFSGKERYAEGTPELDSLREQFKREYLPPFDKIAKTYFSSAEKAWKQLFEYASSWPEPAKSRFLWAVKKYDRNKHEQDKRYHDANNDGIDIDDEDASYFVMVSDTFKEEVWRTFLKQKMTELPQILRN